MVGCGGNDEPSDVEPSQSSEPPVSVAPALPENGEMTVSELHEKLKEKNPAYSNGGQFRKAGGEIRIASLCQSGVTDLSPLAGLPLQNLDLRGLAVSDISVMKGMPLEELYLEETKVTDLSALKGAPLRVLYLNDSAIAEILPLADSQITHLNLTGTQVEDISPLRNVPLNTLWLQRTKVRDLSPLVGKNLESLDVQDTPVEDLTPLVGMTTLKRLNVAGSHVSDLTPLFGMHLTRLLFTPSQVKKGLEVVRAMDSLQELDVEFREPQRMSPSQFWEAFDAGELKK